MVVDLEDVTAEVEYLEEVIGVVLLTVGYLVVDLLKEFLEIKLLMVGLLMVDLLVVVHLMVHLPLEVTKEHSLDHQYSLAAIMLT